jgi:hypothetical protein
MREERVEELKGKLEAIKEAHRGGEHFLQTLLQ